MDLKQQIDQDLNAAMLAGDKFLATTLRGVKSAVLYAEVAANKREEGLADADMLAVLRKEAKKRQESADLYKRGGSEDRAASELAELKAIQKYLPPEMSEADLQRVVDQAIAEIGDITPQMMGRVIARVKELTDGSVEGGRIATAVKERIER